MLAAIVALGILHPSGATAAASSSSRPPAKRAQGSQTIAVEPLVSKLSSYGGVLAWSHWDAAARVYHLIARIRGHTEVLPVAPRSVAFDVDLGPDPLGRAVAVYSRCRHEQEPWLLGVTTAHFSAPSGCELYRYDFAIRHERRIGAIVGAGAGSFYLPTIWRNEIAYVRLRAENGVPALYAQPLSAPRHRRIAAIPLPGGPTGGPGPVSLDLRGSELAFAWDNGGRGQFDSGIYLDRLPASTRRAPTQLLADAESSDLRSPGLIGFPSLAAGEDFYGRFDGSAILPNDDAFARIGLDGSGAALAPAPHALRAQTRDGNTTYAIYGPYLGTFSSCGAGGCALVAIPGAP